jgi:hypothetical protein
MTQLIEAIGWVILFFAGMIALVLLGSLCVSLVGTIFGTDQDTHGFGMALPIVGLVLFALPGLLVGWSLVAYARHKRSHYERAI